MAGESSPGTLQDPGPHRPLKNNTPRDNSISDAESQPAFLIQLESQSTPACVSQDEKKNQNRLVQSGKPEDKQVLETNESFSFAPQPKHKPNQFSGRQRHLNIDFETFEAPKDEAERVIVDTPPSEPVRSRQRWERTSPKDSRDHHRKIAGSQTGNSSSHIHQGKQSQLITGNGDQNSVQPELEHIGIRAGMPTQYISSGMSPPFGNHSAVGGFSDSQKNSIDCRPSFAMEGRLNDRPFADADASFPGFHRTPAQKSGQSPVIDKGTMLCLNGPRGAVNGMAEPMRASDIRMETIVGVDMPQSHNGNSSERAKHEQQCHTPRYKKQHLKANVFHSHTPVGDLELPQKSTPSTAGKQREHRTPRQQPIQPSRHEEEQESVSRRTLSRHSNVSRHQLSRNHQKRHSQLTQEGLGSKGQADRRDGQPHKQNHVQKSHFRVLQSMINHHNMFLEHATLTEESLRAEIAGQERTVEALKTRMERSYLHHQQEQEHQKTLNAEISSLLQQKKDEVIAIMAQRDGREKELGAEVAKLQALGEVHAAEKSDLRCQLEDTQSKLQKLHDKGRGYKDHLNRAIAEHQELWQQSRNISQKAINDMRKEHQESEEHFRSALEQKQGAQDKLNRIFNDKRATAASKTKSLESALGKLEGDLLAEADKTKGLEEQLSKSRERETFLLRVEDNIRQIFDKLSELHVKSVQAHAVPINVTERQVRLDKITAYVQSAPWAELGDEIRQALNNFQKEIMPQFLQQMKGMATERSTIEDRLQSLEKIVQNQAVLAGTERQKQQDQLLRQISQEKKEIQDLFLTLQPRKNQMTEIFKAVSDVAHKLQELKTSAVPASQNGTTSEAEFRGLQELLLIRDHQVSEIQSKLKLQCENHEVTLRELRERLLQAEEDVRQKSELVKNSQCKTLTEENGIATKAQEKKRELELQLRHSEDSRQNIQQQLSESEAEIKRLKTLRDNSEVITLRKELNDANQRIVNLTLKFRETQTTAVDIGVLDQLAEQLVQLNNMKEDIRQLKISGKTYAMVGKELATMLSIQDASIGDDILAPDSLVIPEPDLPDLQQGTSSETALVQSGKKTVFRRPVEEPYQEVPAPSVAQEKLDRRKAKGHGPHPKPILRQKRMATGSLNTPKEPLVTRHAGHSLYNRPVQSAFMAGPTAISDIRSNLLGDREVQISHLMSHGDWQKITADESQGVQQGTKRSSSLPPSSQRSKRSKTSFHVNNDDSNEGSSVAGEGSIVNSQQMKSSQQTEIDSSQSSQGQSQDNDHTSPHFHQSTHKPGADTSCRGNVGHDKDSQQKQQPAKIQNSTKAVRKESLRSAILA
ncbi:hypothetical protein CSUB01_00578 [Colletotrichum sublineola]|uniref:Uncharacterized protein n=1 Tax=Colletotrichum sublineola TaxID=1173701 RepID=A0A066X639_COLSU|nr:hypothetical protein CSUB01_00578 [Colletotrichum sublineola]